MSRTYYSEINLHLVWHTKSSLPLLMPDVETFTHRYLRQRLVHTPGAFLHEVNGTETHVHLVVTVPPTRLVSDLIGQLKGASAHAANHQFSRARKVLEWQSGYGVVSFGLKDREWVVNYVRRQKEHHRSGTVHDRLERITAEATAEAGPREAP